MISFNALLKDRETLSDPGHAFKYDQIAEMIRRYSYQVEADLDQLVRIMLFNRMINNTDDHERNFSLMHDGGGYRLSDAYDLVPSLSLGAYHAAGYQYSPFPPTTQQARQQGRILKISKTVVERCADSVENAINQWVNIAETSGVSERDMEKIQQVLAPIKS